MGAMQVILNCHTLALPSEQSLIQTENLCCGKGLLGLYGRVCLALFASQGPKKNLAEGVGKLKEHTPCRSVSIQFRVRTRSEKLEPLPLTKSRGDYCRVLAGRPASLV